MRSWALSRWIAVAAIALLAIVVSVLAYAAYQRANPDIDPDAPVPAPSFSLGVQTPAATPSPTSVAPGSIALDTQRFLSIGGIQWWRATAGACDGQAPLIERSPDRGGTWLDVTPNYRGVMQVQSLDALSAEDAEMVAALAGCQTQALRTYTYGEFWEPYPDVLATSRFVAATDAATVVFPSGPVAAPCAQAWGFRASGDTAALICEARAWRWNGTEWQQLGPQNVVAVTLDGADVIVGHSSPGCNGIGLSRVTSGTPSLVGCAEGLEPSSPTAIDLSGQDVHVWSADSLVSVPIP
jgi:hypothetical protein